LADAGIKMDDEHFILDNLKDRLPLEYERVLKWKKHE